MENNSQEENRMIILFMSHKCLFLSVITIHQQLWKLDMAKMLLISFSSYAQHDCIFHIDYMSTFTLNTSIPFTRYMLWVIVCILLVSRHRLGVCMCAHNCAHRIYRTLTIWHVASIMCPSLEQKLQ